MPIGIVEFARRPGLGINYVTHERFRLLQLDEHVDMGDGAVFIGRLLPPRCSISSMNWEDVAEMVRHWDRHVHHRVRAIRR